MSNLGNVRGEPSSSRMDAAMIGRGISISTAPSSPFTDLSSPPVEVAYNEAAGTERHSFNSTEGADDRNTWNGDLKARRRQARATRMQLARQRAASAAGPETTELGINEGMTSHDDEPNDVFNKELGANDVLTDSELENDTPLRRKGKVKADGSPGAGSQVPLDSQNLHMQDDDFDSKAQEGESAREETPTEQTPAPRKRGRPKGSTKAKMLAKTMLADALATPTTNGEGGVRRSGRDRRVTTNFVVVELQKDDRDLNAPIMGEGKLRKRNNRKSIASGGNPNESGNEESYGAGGRVRGFPRRVELDRIRRQRITTIINNGLPEQLPDFPPEFGFKIKYFRDPTPPLTPLSHPEPSDGQDQNLPNKRRRTMTTPTYVGEDTVEDGYEPICALYTFHPTKEIFQNFEEFVKIIEPIGRKAGVIKIKVPQDCIPPPPPSDQGKSEQSGDVCAQTQEKPQSPSIPRQAASCHTATLPIHSRDSSLERSIPIEPGQIPINAFRQEIKRHEKVTSNFNSVYYIHSIRGEPIPADYWLQAWKERNECAMAEESIILEEEGMTEDVFLQVATDITEKRLKAVDTIFDHTGTRGSIFYGTDNEATDELRSFFGLSAIDLVGFVGNTLAKTLNKVTGIHTPYFYFASPLSCFALHLEDYAALSINFHHTGAPKKWIVVCPSDSEKLETLVTGMLGLSSRDTSCNQFIRHSSLFIPSKVLRRAGIRYTEVTQRPGDMIITFPWAYHEGWNAGMNVAEAIGYGNKNWEGWVDYYRTCRQGTRLCGDAKPIELQFPEGFGAAGVNGVARGTSIPLDDEFQQTSAAPEATNLADETIIYETAEPEALDSEPDLAAPDEDNQDSSCAMHLELFEDSMLVEEL